ncbi:MAG: protein-L-isoaspartate(D-aspartate) O-methyltransferase [Bacteroidales bacterium]|nr:protein-L-isoaspartate(D-aspartate) O-methyltransferase [Bacteroidales bacterium]
MTAPFKITAILILIALQILAIRCPSDQTEEYSAQNFETDSLGEHPGFSELTAERERMVREDIQNYPYYPVRDRKVLNAMKRVPRHLFVPEALRHQAYGNHPIPIGHNQTISQPFIVASMTELLDLSGDEKILEIGTGSGYQAAVLAEICDEVYTMEIIPELGKSAQKLLAELGYHNIHVKIGDGYEGWPEHAPYDRIIVTCAPDDIPEPLIEQLNFDGRIVIPIGQTHQIQTLVVVIKDRNGKLLQSEYYPVRFVPMTR